MIKQSNNLNMKKFYTLLLCALSVFAISAQGPMKAKGDVTYYDGEVNISMSGMELADGMPVTITLEEGEDSNVYELVLADFELALMPGQEPILLGDIVVPNVAFTDDNGDGISDVTGTIDDVSLAEGQINAKVDISGESRQDGSLDLTIDVLWYSAYPDKDTTIPIAVTFTGEKRNGGVAGIADNGVKVYGVAGAVKVDGYNGVAEVYSVDGRMIKKQMVSDGSQIDLASGLYIVRVADKSVKVAVR